MHWSKYHVALQYSPAGPNECLAVSQSQRVQDRLLLDRRWINLLEIGLVVFGYDQPYYSVQTQYQFVQVCVDNPEPHV